MNKINEYTLEIKNNEINEIDNLPYVPFVIELREGGDIYLVSELKFKNNYIVTGLSKGAILGKSYDNNYTKENILKLLNDGSWKLRKSQIILT